MSGNGILKSTTVVLILIGALFGLASCTGVSQEEFDRISKDLDVARTMLAGYAAEPEITQAGTALLSAIASWHLLWGTPGLRGYEREEMVSVILDLTEPAGNLLEEQLALRIDNYALNHALFRMVESNTAFRAASFGSASGLGDSMPNPCSLPVANAVPEEFKGDWLLLSIECQTLELFEYYLFQTRILAEETWLRPFID